MNRVKISVICPVWNEEAYIGRLLEFVTNALPEDKELLLIEGGSTDNTLHIISQWQSLHGWIRLLHNPHRIVPYALNLAIPQCTGQYIVRLDAHTDYAKDYFERILDCFERTSADIVGGPTRTRSTTDFQAAVAHAICTPFGIGDSRVHQEDYEGPSDSVTFGAWRKEIFETTGLFDTDLVRNQDDEFHYRATSLGFKIYQDPSIRLYYYPRSNLGGLFRQYYQYGLYKPLVLRKVPSGGQWRHRVPSIFSIYLMGLHILVALNFWFLFPLALYLVLDIYYSFDNELSLKSRLWCMLVYPAIHLGYGFGFIFGSIRLFFSESNRV